MEEPSQLIDICVVCALPEETKAFLDAVQQQYNNAIEERISPRYQYSYRFATIKNDKNETLNLHISWLPRYGPQEMTLHLSRVLEECQPRIVIMTGICAGDPQQVQLGDLVVAERTFTYDNGKYTFDEQGRRMHQHDTMTYQLDANILQFLGLFSDWEPLVARLERPSPQPEQSKVACYIKAMASGSAVRADRPFEDVQTPVRGTAAIDMEGAAFGLVMNRHPLTPWLIVKGVSDYADKTKNDDYHRYAAYASALYALSFIQAYVTNDRLSRPGETSPLGHPGLAVNAPYPRDPHFRRSNKLGNSRVERYYHRIARRPVILGLGLAGLILVGGGITWFTVAHDHAVSSSLATPSPRSLPLSLGTRLYIFRGHSQQIRGIAWSPDGKHIASASYDNTVRVWEVTEGGHVYVYLGHFSAVYTVAWSPNGKFIASAGYDQTVQVWDPTSGYSIYTYLGHKSTVRGVVWSPDSKRIASGDENSVQVWDAADGGNVYVHPWYNGEVVTVAWSPDGKRIAAGSTDKTVQIWDAKNGDNPYVYSGHAGTVYAVAWSPNSQRIASGSTDKSVQVWDAKDGSNLYRYVNHTDSVISVVWSPDGTRIASGAGDKTVQVWDAKNGGNMYVYHGHIAAVYAVDWSHDGTRIASGGVDTTVQVWGAE